MRAIVHRIGEEDAPAVFRQLHVLEVRPAFRVDADRRAHVDLVVVLEPLRPHVLPPLDVLRLPVLERALQPLVAREVDVVRDLLGGDHRHLSHPRRTQWTRRCNRMPNQSFLRVPLCRLRSRHVYVRFQSNSGRPCCPYDLQRAFFADGVRPLEDPVLPRRQPAEDLRLHRLGPGEAQVRFEAGHRVGRERGARLDRQRTSSSQSISSGAKVTSPASSASAALNGPSRASERRRLVRLAEEPRLQPRQPVAHRQQPAVHRRQRDRRSLRCRRGTCTSGRRRARARTASRRTRSRAR